MSFAALLHDVARRVPQRLAVTFEGETQTYADLMHRAGQLAAGLQRLGVAPGDRVVIFLDNCTAFFECLIGCWVAGACAVPVNAKLHAREVAHIVADSGATLVFTSTDHAAGLAEIGTLPVVGTDTRDYERLVAGDAIAPVAAAPPDRAWLFYTSGTTGRPKGAVLTHRNLLAASIAYYADVDRVGPHDTLLHGAPLSHGSGLTALSFLLMGAHNVVLPGFDIPLVADSLARYANVSMFAVPTTLTRLVDAAGALADGTRNLKTIYYGGGPAYVADLERALDVFGPKLYQLYGQGESPMTITGLDQALHADRAHPDFLRRLGSCGYPRTGVRVKIVDADDREVAPGTVGEIATTSDVVMAEYWKNPDATATTLRGGWLHTGDLGSVDADGLLTLSGRSKDLIISGGSNIYPREVEEALLRHPDLAEVSVVGRPHPDWGEEVVAFVVTRPQAHVEAAELDRLCLDHIARFKRPKAYRFVAALPKNNYGKVLKTELRVALAGELKA